MAEQTFDPRFDPAFQRGYVPPVAAAAPAAPAVPAPADSVGEPPVDSDPRQEEKIAPALAARRGVNPYVVVLWVVGVVFAVGGTALLFGSYFMMYTHSFGGPSQSNATAQVLFAFGSAFGVPLITVGLATIAGVIFFSAWRSWQRRGGTSS